MKILKFIPVILIALIAGCSEKQKPQNECEQIKLEDLMPQGEGPRQSDKMIVGLSVFFFQLDADKYPQVHKTLADVNGLNINLRDPQNFNANGLICGGGDSSHWQKIAASLANTNILLSERITYFTEAGSTEIIEAARFSESANVSYRTAENAAASIGFPDGAFIFKLSTQTLIGLRQACKLIIEPSYKTSPKKLDNKRIPAWEYSFDSAALSAAIRPGQFIFLAPELNDQIDEQPYISDLGQSIFVVKDRKDVTKFIMIFCGLIKD